MTLEDTHAQIVKAHKLGQDVARVHSAAAAALGQELTIPEVAQSIVLTRMSMQSTSMPARETLENFAKTGSTLAIHLAIRNMREIERQLIPHYGEDCPAVVGYRVKKVRAAKITRTALVLVGPALAEQQEFVDSALYDASKPHVLRPVTGVDLVEDFNT